LSKRAFWEKGISANLSDYKKESLAVVISSDYTLGLGSCDILKTKFTVVKINIKKDLTAPRIEVIPRDAGNDFHTIKVNLRDGGDKFKVEDYEKALTQCGAKTQKIGMLVLNSHLY
jgi:hypothetical protein